MAGMECRGRSITGGFSVYIVLPEKGNTNE